MSRFSTMTTAERKAQAAAICREIQALEDMEVDLGKKVSVPQDIMLEELSLESNRGSRLFKMRQQRADKYTFENARNDVNSQRNNTTEARADNVNSTEEHNSAEKNSGVDRACPQKVSSETATVPDPHSIAPGYGGPLKDVPPEKFNSTAIPKSYHSPWDRALVMKSAPIDTLVPLPEPPANLPGYKSFNRCAIPFGGFAEAHGHAGVQNTMAETVLPDFPELRSRPSFNRAAQGWGSTGPSLALHPAPESDDI
ncbi:myozenin-2-like [Syngnathus acus]|uniref:myozenin-2-like n=1 Tax=Syngnathus acus TaxID=161584 RepID=UPI001886096D|nr:myozenin-2-like [Syngnathus acus]XP_037116541.1 myozenin-2-like [Syngnathus acus]